jgi:hypothetical protein
MSPPNAPMKNAEEIMTMSIAATTIVATTRPTGPNEVAPRSHLDQ